MAKRIGVLWADWIAQPPEHRELYLAHEEFDLMRADVERYEKDREAGK